MLRTIGNKAREGMMIFDADVFVPVTDELQFAVRSQSDSYSPVFIAARELLGIDSMSLCPEVIYDGFVHITKVDQAITEIFDQSNSGKDILFRVVDENGSLVGWQVSVCYNDDDCDYDDEDYYDGEEEEYYSE
jgi:hypothetical protein